MSITDFLLARVAEDEAWARHALAHIPGEGTRDAERRYWLGDYDEDPVDGTTQNGLTAVGDELTWLAINPSRVLAECAAKRAIVAMLHGTFGNYYVEQVVGHLASAYSDHADYDPSWTV